MISQILEKFKQSDILNKLVILLILASFVNILFPYGVLASEIIADNNRENLGQFRQTVIYNPNKVPVE